ncbi:response regulator [Candidatus Atribacteria bacterium 1244-E10-H5-B2]|nr:MAG: response regulator [Candidatus Atribacteria bacterium 1244-E10-H5-B2]
MKILIVDDIEENLYLLESILKGSGYEVVTAKDGVEALSRLKEESIDMIVSDILMPRMDGFQLCRECKKDENLKKIPFIFYTATYTEKKDEEFALSLGVEKFIVKPQEPEVLLKILEEVIEGYRKGTLVAPKELIKEEEIYLTEYNKRLITKLEKKVLDLEKSEKRLQKTMEDTIYTIGKIAETRDPYTAGHQKNVSQIAIFIAREMKLPKDKIEGIRIASLVHDIGKISLPAEILNKPTKLSEMEYGLIKDHSQVGYDVLKSIEFSWPVAQIVLQHHERLDGSGYPQGLKGEDILLEAKIIGVADVVEAMSSHRPYRPAWGIDKALEEISKNKGILYDPKVVDACLKLFKRKEFKF